MHAGKHVHKVQNSVLAINHSAMVNDVCRETCSQHTEYCILSKPQWPTMTAGNLYTMYIILYCQFPIQMHTDTVIVHLDTDLYTEHEYYFEPSVLVSMFMYSLGKRILWLLVNSINIPHSAHCSQLRFVYLDNHSRQNGANSCTDVPDCTVESATVTL